MEKALARKLLGKRPARELHDFLGDLLPPLESFDSPKQWRREAARVRRELLASFLRGHPRGISDEPPRVVWTETLTTGKGYRIRKLRYEGYPGMWVPALLYEPTSLRGRVPVVLNPNGHHSGGKAMAYKQARCINLAKRGMLALNTEFIGMGVLCADSQHNRIALLDLVGVAGVGLFYLLMKRGLDVLLAHQHADPARVAMTGLSGGGWQTALLSALDTRVTAIVPVAGFTATWQRRGCLDDIGDLEQLPSDMCAIADYDKLAAMFAPRPTLLIYNRFDDCFRTARARRSIYRPARDIFELLGAGEQLEFHDNTDPGTHNYDRDNREQLYRFLNRHFDIASAATDLPWKSELLTEQQLTVGLPDDNATTMSLAQARRRQLQHAAKPRRHSAAGRQRARARLADVIRLADCSAVRTQQVAENRRKGTDERQFILNMADRWSLGVTAVTPATPRGALLVVSDGGRAACGSACAAGVAAGKRVIAADLFGTGESSAIWQQQMIVAATGQRPLGLQVGQLLGLATWARKRFRMRSLDVHAQGQVLSVVTLIAAAVRPTFFGRLTTTGLVDSLGRLIDLPVTYEQAAPLFCFGLLREFDIPDLIDLAQPVSLADTNRGPLRS